MNVAKVVLQYKGEKVGIAPFNRNIANSSNYRFWFQDNAVTKYNSHGKFNMTENQIESFLDSLGSKDQVVFAIFCLPDKESQDEKARNLIHVGNVSLQKIDFVNGSAEYAIIIGEPDFYRKGLATEATKMILYHGFYKLGLSRIYAGTPATNTGMIKVFEKIGFTHEGTERRAMFLNGTVANVERYSMLYADEAAHQLIKEGREKHE